MSSVGDDNPDMPRGENEGACGVLFTRPRAGLTGGEALSKSSLVNGADIMNLGQERAIKIQGNNCRIMW